MDNVLANDVGVDVDDDDDDDDDEEFGNNDFVIDGKDIDCISAIIDDVPLLACFECFGVFGVLGIFGVCGVIGDINDDDDEKRLIFGGSVQFDNCFNYPKIYYRHS